MGTLAKEVELKSVALMSGIDSAIRVVPSDKKGIRFHLQGNSVEARIENVLSTQHCDVIGNDKIQIVLIEHFMAACSILGIDSLDVYLSHNELPILDGSARIWVESFKNAGIKSVIVPC